VSLADVEAFRSWREDPGNRAAYDRIDGAWRDAGALRDDDATRWAVSDALQRGAARRAGRERRRAWLAGAAVASAVVVLVAGGGALYMATHSTYATAVGEQRLVRLADGSTVRLDTDTQIDVALSGRSRRVTLDHGQAFFDVAHDPARPFSVSAGPITVRAVGTRFDVRDDGPVPQVTLVQGIVQVTRAAARPRIWTLQPGQQLVAAAATTTPKPIDVAAATSWTSGRVVFQNIPLSAAVDEINRYCEHKIILRAPGLAATPVSGSFETGDENAFVAAESDLHGLRVTHLPDGSIALDAASTTSD
jgi:transmembrane sensor